MWGEEASKALARLEESLGKIGGLVEVGDEIQHVNILGTEYEVSIHSVEEDPKLEHCVGYCEQYSKKIVLSDMAVAEKDVMAVENIDEFKKKVLRREIIHAFFGESGLRSCSEYAEDEELVDWIAIQFPKILKAFNEVGAL